MTINNVIIIAYVILFSLAIALAAAQKKTFPFAESLMVVGIVGVVFTGLVYLATLPVKADSITTVPTSGELVFTILYVFFVAIFLMVKPKPKNLPGQFLKEKIAAISTKLLIFVLIPLMVLRNYWHITWADLGFSAGDVGGQLFAAAILIFAFGGFNFLAGSAAAPIRNHKFSGRQVMLGMAAAFVWNMIETGLVEEFFFRAFLQTRLVNALGSPLAGICLTSLLFGLAHAPGIYLRRGDKLGPLGEKPTGLNTILYSVIVLSSAGWFTGVLYWRTQSLLAPILVHAAVDAVAHTGEFIEGLHL